MKGDLKAVKTEAQIVTIDLDTAKSDVGDVAKAIAHSKTPHVKLVAPAAALVVPVKGVTKEDTAKARMALQDIKGVVAKESTAQQGEIIVQLDNEGGAKLSDITKALKSVSK
ncbi:MAG: hypothetical protein L0Y72_25800 [Gemmataceae bacterium]|nr:hypothetical protein [Gemmataceae bacterium]